MKKSVHIILIVFTLLLVLLLFLLFFLYTVDLIVNQQVRQGFFDIVQLELQMRKIADDDASLQQLIREQAEIIHAHIIVVDMNSHLFADSHTRTSDISGKYINAVISDAKRNGSSSRMIHDRRSGDLLVSVARKIETPSHTVVVSCAYQLERTKQFTYVFIIFAIALAITLAGLVLLIVQYALRLYQRPLKKFLQHTKSFQKDGHAMTQVQTTVPELRELVDNFNALNDRYLHLITSDNEKYSRINTLLATMKTGIIMVGKNNEITLVNPKAEELLQLNKLELFKNPTEDYTGTGLINRIMIETSLVNAARTGRYLSLERDDKSIIDIDIDVMYNKYQPHEHCGALVILRDVTQMRHLERLKDEFVANVSHELRTPLTVINGFVETLQSWELLSDTDRDTALSIISVETERLKKLISDLLMLSCIEGHMSSVSKDSFDPVSLVLNVVDSLRQVSTQRGITTDVEVNRPIAPIYGIANWFRQIIFNLYDNAIKYSEDDSSVTVRVKEEKDVLIIEIEDHGIGISEEDLPRIFERFYRVEKSRNSKIPGSGIGLSITQLMVMEFGGTIDVTSKKHIGSCFQVTFPKHHIHRSNEDV